jgi:hypothetical protein
MISQIIPTHLNSNNGTAAAAHVWNGLRIQIAADRPRQQPTHLAFVMQPLR